MKTGPDIAFVASLLGDPARANMLTALLAGEALTAGELAREAGVTAQTASSHLGKLVSGGLISERRQGRHCYFSLAGPDVSSVLEKLMSLAARTGHRRTRPGPSEPELRRARVCYDHLAGDLGVSAVRRTGFETPAAAAGRGTRSVAQGRSSAAGIRHRSGGCASFTARALQGVPGLERAPQPSRRDAWRSASGSFLRTGLGAARAAHAHRGVHAWWPQVIRAHFRRLISARQPP